MARVLKNEESISAVTAKIINIILKMSFEQRRRLLFELSKFQGINTRKHDRRDCLMNVQYLVNGKLFSGFILNISTGGVFIECPRDVLQKMTDGLPVTLTFDSPDKITPIKTYGQIQRIADSGVGIRFNNELPQKAIAAFH